MWQHFLFLLLAVCVAESKPCDRKINKCSTESEIAMVSTYEARCELARSWRSCLVDLMEPPCSLDASHFPDTLKDAELTNCYNFGTVPDSDTEDAPGFEDEEDGLLEDDDEDIDDLDDDIQSDLDTCDPERCNRQSKISKARRSQAKCSLATRWRRCLEDLMENPCRIEMSEEEFPTDLVQTEVIHCPIGMTPRNETSDDQEGCGTKIQDCSREDEMRDASGPEACLLAEAWRSCLLDVLDDPCETDPAEYLRAYNLADHRSECGSGDDEEEVTSDIDDDVEEEEDNDNRRHHNRRHHGDDEDEAEDDEDEDDEDEDEEDEDEEDEDEDED